MINVLVVVFGICGNTIIGNSTSKRSAQAMPDTSER